jgi:hypothetical protein
MNIQKYSNICIITDYTCKYEKQINVLLEYHKK